MANNLVDGTARKSVRRRSGFAPSITIDVLWTGTVHPVGSAALFAGDVSRVLDRFRRRAALIRGIIQKRRVLDLGVLAIIRKAVMTSLVSF
jgi:hypothetical protein